MTSIYEGISGTKFYYILLFFFIVLFSPNTSISISDSQAPIFSLIVTPNYLNSIKTVENIIIIDVRNNNSYQMDHIVHARNLPVSSTFDRYKNDRVASLHDTQKLIQQVGIGEDDWVILYDNGDLIDAARVFWVFEFYGHNKVSILDGGYQKWKEKGFKITNLGSEIIAASDFIANIQPEKYTSILNMRLAINNQSNFIIDSRELAEYRGEKSITKKLGHIPNSNSIPWSSNFENNSATGKLKNIDDLTKIYSAIKKNKHIITYCNKGKQSSLTYFILRRLGYMVSHYDGSWYEWSNKDQLPIEK